MTANFADYTNLFMPRMHELYFSKSMAKIGFIFCLLIIVLINYYNQHQLLINHESTNNDFIRALVANSTLSPRFQFMTSNSIEVDKQITRNHNPVGILRTEYIGQTTPC